MEFCYSTKYHLGDGTHYFKYREDKYMPSTIRADLFNINGEIIYKTVVRGGFAGSNKTHHDIINEFEVFVHLYAYSHE